MRRPAVIAAALAIVAVVLPVGVGPAAVIAAYLAIAGLVGAALRVRAVRNVVLVAVGCVLLLASLRPPWGKADKRELRYKFSLTTVTRVIDVAGPAPPPQWCSWVTGRGTPRLCAPDPTRAWRFFLLATAPALVGLGIVFGIGAAAWSDHRRASQLALVGGSVALIGAAMICLNIGAGLALFRGARLAFGGIGAVHGWLGGLLLMGGGLITRRQLPAVSPQPSASGVPQ